MNQPWCFLDVSGRAVVRGTYLQSGGTHHQEKTEGVQERGGAVRRQSGFDLETAGGQDDGDGDPETTVGRERRGTESVADRHFPRFTVSIVSRPHRRDSLFEPHASKKLDETTVAKGRTDHQTRPRDAASAQVDEGQDERGQGEGAEAEGRRVGELAVLGRLVQTGLEFTAEGREADAVAGVGVREPACALVCLSRLMEVPYESIRGVLLTGCRRSRTACAGGAARGRCRACRSPFPSSPRWSRCAPVPSTLSYLSLFSLSL